MGRTKPEFSGAHLILLVEDFRKRHDRHIAKNAAGVFRPGYTRVLFNLDHEKGTRLADLARMGGVRIQSMAQLVDEMEEAGLVERTPDPEDGRAKRIRFTRKGLSVQKASTAAGAAVWDDYAKMLGKTELRAFQRQLENLVYEIGKERDSDES